MPSSSDRKLNTALKAWRRVCPEDPLDVSNLRSSLSASTKIKKALATARFEIKGAGKNASPYDDFNEKEVDRLLKQVEDYVDALQQQDKEFAELKKWLSKVKSSSTPLPCSLVVKGNDKGSLHVHKTESNVQRSARSGKSEITGSKVHPGTCKYDTGKLVFMFEGTARAPWRPLLQSIVSKAGLNMRVAIAGVKDSDDPSQKN